MSGMNKFGLRPHTILNLVAAAVTLIGLLLWALVPTITQTNKPVADGAQNQVEQQAPELQNEAEPWLPEMKERIDRWLPESNTTNNDVSGSDIGPVPRFPGLLRTGFARTADATQVTYSGTVPFAKVLKHYLTGFSAAGYSHEVIAASTSAEEHHFRLGQALIELSLTRQPRESLELHLTLTETR